MREAGCVGNCNIATTAIGKVIVLTNNRTLLKENGVSLNLDFSIVSINFLENWLYQKGEQQQQSSLSPGYLKEIGFSFHWDIKEVFDAYDIPDDLVININQKPLPFILLSKYTMDKKNKKNVLIKNSADSRQVI